MGPVVVIPAVKKNVAFPDDLVKKLAGRTLILRVIDNAINAFGADLVRVVTDSEEITLLCHRQGIKAIYDRNLRIDPDGVLESLKPHLLPLLDEAADFLVLSPYVPMINADELRRAYSHYCDSGADLLRPVVAAKVRPFEVGALAMRDILHDGGEREELRESRAFAIFRGDLLLAEGGRKVSPAPYRITDRLVEIRSYEDWWICEKLLSRKRIVFRIVGSRQVGMGHIFRSLTLAHEIADHEVRFVCDRDSETAAAKLAGYDYWLGVYDSDKMAESILALKPDLVINDILDTEEGYVRRLQAAGVRVANFEDLGSGASAADITINDLYDEPLLLGPNILWGRPWFFVRDEFATARPHRFERNVSAVMVAFGGTDPSDLTRTVLSAIGPFCAEREIEIVVVTGDGYPHIAELEAMIAGMESPHVTYTHATGVISHLMEKTQIAVCSNGRTVYEFAHMNIPAIVFSHHEREKTHRFACEENGFIPLGIYRGRKSAEQLLDAFHRLVDDRDWRHQLHARLRKTDFASNKRKVIDRILALLPAGTTQ